ncbi:hypothetical protein B0A49_00629 [Cryomyces minteri]|uniref:Major facilitator superfamily (MFS) profile domain-containing protein n=1 Tax=Cryomyces minteri TaxID=331657 RepID=A0A4U0XV35_9PEZI|nr:hypothetical protein B0A49_00629 [Cryomyces minteri]
MAGYRYAFSLSKEEVRDAQPPGTVLLVDHRLERTASGLGTHKVDHIHLVPQPSHDPADPLNWPKWRKIAILLCVSLFAFVTNLASASLASALPLLAMQSAWPVTVAKLTQLVSVNILMVGASNLWWVPLANLIGRRPIILVSLVILTLSSMWCGLAQSYDSLLVARLFQGIGGGAADTVSPDIVGEVFFVHQRGRAMAVYTVFLALGPIVGGIAGSYIAAALGWLETSHGKGSVEILEDPSSDRHFQKFTLSRSLKIGVYRGNAVEKFIAPYLTLRLPGVWLVMLHYGGLVGGIVTVSTIGPQLVSQPPYLWGRSAGLVNLGGLVGTILGAVLTYVTADRSIKRQAKRESHGFGEPESRLPILLPGLFIATTGLWVFGFCAAHPGPGRWVGLEVGYGMITFGLMQVPSIGFNYYRSNQHTRSYRNMEDNGLPHLSRFITDHNDQGKAVYSTAIPEALDWQELADGYRFSLGYTTNQFPVNLSQGADIKTYQHYTANLPGIMVPGGTVLRIVDMKPGATSPMHRTVSLDYGVVLEGEVWLILDSGEVRLMKRGDTAIQRGTNHAWRNASSSTWARMLYVLQEAAPLEVQAQKLEEDYGGLHGVRPSG